ncbi:hypothetical protein ARNL5_02801 [Anaerolineae bacterium]|uniref:hypothetical protein n=1 Tax=Geobacter sp. TaxID=46610 RepID=UPI001ACD67B9|nr:hypothetical protein [Geobacter sp.]CAG0985174.1 hypothetical protein ARNL5_02801 [Anaerolineae bacterium]
MTNSGKFIAPALSFIFGVGAGWIAHGKLIEVLFTAYVPALATLFAAYYGAKYAFDLQHKKQEDDVKKTNLANGNIAMFTLLSMVNSLLNYQGQIIDPIRTNPKAFLEMSPTLSFLREDLSFKIKDLYFLIEKNDPNLLGELMLEEARYKAAMDAINERSRLHIHEIQPLLERCGIIEGGTYTFEEIEKVLGNRFYTTLHQQLAQIIDHVDSALISMDATGKKLNEALKAAYPKERVLAIVVPT